MSEPLLQKGLALLKAATTLDAQGHAQEAITQYLLALEVLVKVHGYEKLETNKALLKEKIELYMARVEQLRGGPASHTAAAPVASAPPAPELRLPEVPTGAPQHARGPGVLPAIVALAPKTVSIKLNETGHTYHTLFAAYLRGAVRVVVEELRSFSPFSPSFPPHARLQSVSQVATPVAQSASISRAGGRSQRRLRGAAGDAS